MDSSDEKEDILVIDDNSSFEEPTVVEPDVDLSRGSAKNNSGFSGGSQNSVNKSSDVEIIDLIHSEDSFQKTDSSPEKGPSPFWNAHPKLKRKFIRDSCWGSPKKVKSESDISDNRYKNESGLSVNKTQDHPSPHNLLEEHTYARKVSLPGTINLQKPVSSSTEIKEKGLEKIQLELSALCTVLYSLQKKEIVSISINEFYNLTESLQSSGVFAAKLNTSDLTSRSSSPKSQVINSSNSCSSTLLSPPNSGTLQNKVNRKNEKDENSLPPVSFHDLPKPDRCVCSKPCICSLVIESKHINRPQLSSGVCKVEPVVTSTSNSDENFISPVKKIERRGRPRTINRNNDKKEVSNPKPRGRRPLEVKKEKSVVKEEVSSSVLNDVHQCPSNCKYGKDLLVFAKWPADKIYYPAIIHNCFYMDWRYSNNLNVQFFDGAAIKMSSCNIFPASLVNEGAMITYKNTEDEYIDGIVKGIDRNHPVGPKKFDTCISFTIECDEEDDANFGKILNVPYTSTALNDHCFKQLKKSIGEYVLTPHKYSRKTYNVCHENLIEGKRKRRGVEEAVALILSEELNKKEPSLSSLKGVSARKNKKKIESDKKEIVNNEAVGEEMLLHTRRKRKPLTPFGAAIESKVRGELSKSTKKTPAYEVESESTPMNASNKSKGSGRRSSKVDRSLIPSTSTTKRPAAVRELIFRKDVISEEEHSDSEPDDDFEPDFDISIVGGGDIDFECTTYTRTSKKSCGNRFIKSSSKKAETVTGDDESLVNRYGPIPKSLIFAGYSFVLTHGGQNSYYRNKEQWTNCSDSESSKDEEVHLFDHLRLRNQILAGKGQVHNHLLSIPKESLPKTLVISDFFCRTANYLLAAALNIPVYSHQLIVQCCIQNVPLEKMLESELPLPIGITSDRMRHRFTKKRKVEAMKSYMVILASTETNQRLKYWTKLIHLSGGKISYFTPERNIIGGMLSLASVVIVDDYCTPDLVEFAKKNTVPVVSTRWLVDTIIRGHKQTMMSTDLPQYRVDFIMSNHPSAALSESQ